LIYNLLTIAGSDPSGGAGIQADLKAFSARGTYGMAVLTALTAQNTKGVFGLSLVEPDFVRQQIETIFTDCRVDAVKIGMVATAGIAQAIIEALKPYPDIPVVLDPVMVAKGGSVLLDSSAIKILVERLVPLAHVITPNLPEAAVMLGRAVATNREEMVKQAQLLQDRHARAVLLKGGHLTGEDSPDLLLQGAKLIWLEGQRIATTHTHGTGCTLSSALAAELAKGAPLQQAAITAKIWLTGAIAKADQLSVGSGHGPVQHFYQLWHQD